MPVKLTPPTTDVDAARSAAWRDVSPVMRRRIALLDAGRDALAHEFVALEDRRALYTYGRGAPVDLDSRWHRFGADPDLLGPLTHAEEQELTRLRATADRVVDSPAVTVAGSRSPSRG